MGRGSSLSSSLNRRICIIGAWWVVSQRRKCFRFANIAMSSTSVRPYRTLKHIFIEDTTHAQNHPLCVFQGQLVLDIGYRRNCITDIYFVLQIKNLKDRSRYLGLLRFDLSFEVFGDLALGFVMMMGGVRLAGRFDGASEGRVRGTGPREGASFGLAFQPLVGRARGGRQWRGPGPLGPGTDLRGRRQLG